MAIKNIASLIVAGSVALALVAVMAPRAYADGCGGSVCDTVVVPVVPTAARLGSLFVLDNLFAGINSNGLLTNGVTTPGTSLGDLFVLDQLFSTPTGAYVGSNIGSLFVLNGLFAGPNGNGLLTGPGASLGNLFVLGQLFG